MPEVDVCSQDPDLMDYLESGNLVFYGAADIGKSTTVDETERVQQIERLADLRDTVGEYVALDDFYCLYQEYRSSNDAELQEQFEEVLTREHGVCLVTRPRSLDWLLAQTDLTDDFAVTEFDFLVRKFDENEAVDVAAELADDFSEGEIQSHIERLEYTYSFDDETFEEYASYVPFIVSRVSVLGENGGLFPGDLRDISRDDVVSSLRGFGSHLSDSLGFGNLTLPSREELAEGGSEIMEFLRDYDEVYRESIKPFLEDNQENIQGATASVASGVGATAAPVVGPLVVGALLRPDGQAQSRDAAADFFGELLDDELLPPSRCALEEEMDVPPMTLEYLRTVTRPEFHAEVSQLLDADISHLECIAEQTQDEVEEIYDDLDALYSRVTVIEEFISTRTRNAVTSKDSLRLELESLERQYLQVSGSIEVGELELQNVDLDQRYRDVLTGSRIQVLRGPHGTGKTTLSYRLCQRFDGDGYTVRIPQFGQESRSFVKTALEGVQGPLVVYTNYRVGAYSVDNVPQLSYLVRLVDEGVIDKLLIECRDEVYGQLDDEMQTQTANVRTESSVDELWRFKSVFSVPELDEDGIRAIADWVGEITGEQEVVEQQLSSIIEIAGGNPEVSKIAARMVCNGQDLANIQTEDDLLWTDIQNLSSARTDQIQTAQRSIVKWLATTRGLPEDELQQLTEMSQEVFAEALNNLSRYYHTTEDGRYQLRPDVYQEIIFREECLEELDRYVPTLVEQGYESYLGDVALNITICANVPHRERYFRLEKNCLEGAEITLTAILEKDETAQLYYSSMETLTGTDLSLPLDTVDADELVAGVVAQIEQEANNAYQRGRRVHTVDHPESLSLGILSDLTANYVLAERDGDLTDLFRIIIETYRLHQEVSPANSSLLDYREETNYESELQFVVECGGGSFEQIADSHEVDEVVADIEKVLDTVLSLQESELQYPHLDPSEESRRLQSTAVFYTQAVAGIAHAENDPTTIRSFISTINRNLTEAFNRAKLDSTLLDEVSEDEWLSQAYALMIKSLMYEHRFGLVDNWPATIESRVNDDFEAAAQCQFYKYIVEWSATRAELQPKPNWLIWILSHEGILDIATDDEFEFLLHSNGVDLMKQFLAASLGVIRARERPKLSAKLQELLKARTDEMEGNYGPIFQGVVEDLEEIHELSRDYGGLQF